MLKTSVLHAALKSVSRSPCCAVGVVTSNLDVSPGGALTKAKRQTNMTNNTMQILST